MNTKAVRGAVRLRSGKNRQEACEPYASLYVGSYPQNSVDKLFVHGYKLQIENSGREAAKSIRKRKKIIHRANLRYPQDAKKPAGNGNQ